MLHEQYITVLPYGQAKTVLVVARTHHSGTLPYIRLNVWDRVQNRMKRSYQKRRIALRGHHTLSQ